MVTPDINTDAISTSKIMVANILERSEIFLSKELYFNDKDSKYQAIIGPTMAVRSKVSPPSESMVLVMPCPIDHPTYTYAFGFFCCMRRYNRIPNMRRIPNTMMPITPKIQLKALLRMTKNTTANRINVAPSFQIRINREV